MLQNNYILQHLFYLKIVIFTTFKTNGVDMPKIILAENIVSIFPACDTGNSQDASLEIQSSRTPRIEMNVAPINGMGQSVSQVGKSLCITKKQLGVLMFADESQPIYQSISKSLVDSITPVLQRIKEGRVTPVFDESLYPEGVRRPSFVSEYTPEGGQPTAWSELRKR